MHVRMSRARPGRGLKRGDFRLWARNACSSQVARMIDGGPVCACHRWGCRHPTPPTGQGERFRSRRPGRLSRFTLHKQEKRQLSVPHCQKPPNWRRTQRIHRVCAAPHPPVASSPGFCISTTTPSRGSEERPRRHPSPSLRALVTAAPPPHPVMPSRPRKRP